MGQLDRFKPQNILSGFKQKIKYLSLKPFDTSTEVGRGQERNRRIALTAMTAMIGRVISLLTPLITVRITLGYLGEEIYGLWMTVASFFVLIHYADLGLGSGLQTELSHASAHDDNKPARSMVSTAYVFLSCIAIILLLVFVISLPVVNWSDFVKAESEESRYLAPLVVAAIVIPQIINIPLSLISRTQNAMQEAYKSNIWGIIGNLLNLLFVVIFTSYNAGKVAVIGASATIAVFVSFVNNIYYFHHERPELRPSFKLIDSNFGKQLLRTGVAFFILSIFTSISLSIDNWIVARIGNLEDVTPFSLMLRIANIINMVSVMFSAPLWTANGEALERGEFDWVKRQTHKMARLSFWLSFACATGILLFSNPFLHVLTAGVVSTDYILLLGMCLLNILISYTNPYFMVLNGARVIRFQIYNYIIYSAISLGLKFWLGGTYGYSVIPWIGMATYLLLLTVPTRIMALNTINKQKEKYDIKRTIR